MRVNPSLVECYTTFTATCIGFDKNVRLKYKTYERINFSSIENDQMFTDGRKEGGYGLWVWTTSI